MENLHNEPGPESEDNKAARKFYEGCALKAPEQRPDEKLELVDEPDDTGGFVRVQHWWTSEIPVQISGRLRTAHTLGHLDKSLAHWIGVLKSGELIDKNYLGTLKGYQDELTGVYEKDGKVLQKIIGTLNELRPAKRKM